MLGTSESKATTEAGWDGRSVRISYDRYPRLPGLLLKLLGSAEAKEIFPALEFLRRVGPPEGQEELRDEFFAGVIVHLDDSTWDVRDLAARTACTFLLQDDWYSVLEYLFNFYSAENYRSTNGLHGTVSLAKCLLQRRKDLQIATDAGDMKKLVSLMSSKCRSVGLDQPTDKVLLAALEEALTAVDDLYKNLGGTERLSKETPELSTPDLALFAQLPFQTGGSRNSEQTSLVSWAKARTVNIVSWLVNHGSQSDWEELKSLKYDLESDEDVVVTTLDLFRSAKLDLNRAIAVLLHMVQFIRNPWPERVQTSAMKNVAVILHGMDFEALDKSQVSILKKALTTRELLDFSTEHRQVVGGKKITLTNGPELKYARIYARGGILRLLITGMELGDLQSDKKINNYLTCFGGAEVAWPVNEDLVVCCL